MSVSYVLLSQKVDSDCDSVVEEEPAPERRSRRSNTLKVALRFPVKKAAQKRPASEPEAPAKAKPQPKAKPSPPVKDEADSDAEDAENFLSKRAINIKENKAMVRF